MEAAAVTVSWMRVPPIPVAETRLLAYESEKAQGGILYEPVRLPVKFVEFLPAPLGIVSTTPAPMLVSIEALQTRAQAAPAPALATAGLSENQ